MEHLSNPNFWLGLFNLIRGFFVLLGQALADPVYLKLMAVVIPVSYAGGWLIGAAIEVVWKRLAVKKGGQ